MERLRVSYFVKDAREKLEGKNARRLAAIHTGITVAAALVVTLVQYVLAMGIGKTSGLSGLGTQAVLETIQTVLQWANTLLLPFWSLGFLYAAMQWARGNHARKEDLLMGFHRIGPCLGLLINRAILTLAVTVLCANISSVVYMMTPAAASLTELAASAADTQALYAAMEQLTEGELMALFFDMLPMLGIWAVLCCVLLIPLLYRFRLAEYAILNQSGVRALPAMLISATLLRRRCWQLFKLDLRLWWYHGLKVLCSLLLYADLMLTAFGVPLPVSGETAYYITYFIYLAVLFGVEVCFRPQVETAYAGFYEALLEMGPAPRRASAVPPNMPWDED